MIILQEVLSFPTPPFETALTRTFGPREEFRRVLLHALRRCAGQRIFLTLMPDDTLWLVGTHDAAPPAGAVLLSLSAPRVPASEEAVALRVDVIDWRTAAHAYDTLLAQRAYRPLP